MDRKNRLERFKDLVRKESFYVVLFLCLCVIATATVISFRRVGVDSNPKVADSSGELPININDSSEGNIMDNADQVNNSTDNPTTEKAPVDTAKEDEKASTVSNTKSVKFIKPLDGILSRKFTYGTEVVKVNNNKYESIKGIDIASKVGSEVVAVADGVVEEVGNEDGDLSGWYVLIKHTNGMKSKYANLDSNIKVKQDEKVTQGNVIGTVGDTAKKFNNEELGEHLKFQMIDSNGEQVDPGKYFTLKSE